MRGGMKKHDPMVVLALCGVFLLVIPAVCFLMVLLISYWKRATRNSGMP